MPWHNWMPPSFVDDPSYAGAGTVPCPQCARPVAPDMLLPVAHWPDALRTRWRHSTVAYACDACRQVLHREGLLSVADAMRLSGAPEEVALVLDEFLPSPATGVWAAECAAAVAQLNEQLTRNADSLASRNVLP